MGLCQTTLGRHLWGKWVSYPTRAFMKMGQLPYTSFYESGSVTLHELLWKWVSYRTRAFMKMGQLPYTSFYENGSVTLHELLWREFFHCNCFPSVHPSSLIWSDEHCTAQNARYTHRLDHEVSWPVWLFFFSFPAADARINSLKQHIPASHLIHVFRYHPYSYRAEQEWFKVRLRSLNTVIYTD